VQLEILAIALAISYWVVLPPWSMFIAGPVLLVLTTWNIFFIIVALLPIGPMDGHAAVEGDSHPAQEAAREAGAQAPTGRERAGMDARGRAGHEGALGKNHRPTS
jgi:hypothetical protein